MRRKSHEAFGCSTKGSDVISSSPVVGLSRAGKFNHTNSGLDLTTLGWPFLCLSHVVHGEIVAHWQLRRPGGLILFDNTLKLRDRPFVAIRPNVSGSWSLTPQAPTRMPKRHVPSTLVAVSSCVGSFLSASLFPSKRALVTRCA